MNKLLAIIIMSLLIVPVTGNQRDCHTFEGDVVNDSTVPTGTTESCGEMAHIVATCNQVIVTANYDGDFIIDTYPSQDSYEFTLSAEQSYALNVSSNTEFVDLYANEFGSAYHFVAMVYIPVDCDIVYPDDNRVNWQQCDHFVKIYPDGSVYNVETGTGVLVLQVDPDNPLDTCSDDGSVCVYATENGIQYNVIDREGKFCEITP